MCKTLEQWTERHCTDSDSVIGNAHYIKHEIYITPQGDIIHHRAIFKYDDYECEYRCVRIDETVIKEGLK